MNESNNLKLIYIGIKACSRTQTNGQTTTIKAHQQKNGYTDGVMRLIPFPPPAAFSLQPLPYPLTLKLPLPYLRSLEGHRNPPFPLFPALSPTLSPPLPFSSPSYTSPFPLLPLPPYPSFTPLPLPFSIPPLLPLPYWAVKGGGAGGEVRIRGEVEGGRGKGRGRGRDPSHET